MHSGVAWANMIGTAMIIVDQCSNVFFDRTKSLDERPEVMDIFTSAIGDVVRSRNTEMKLNIGKSNSVRPKIPERLIVPFGNIRGWIRRT